MRYSGAQTKRVMLSILESVFSILVLFASLQISRSDPFSNGIQLYFDWKSFTFDSLPHSIFSEVVPGHRYYDGSSIIPTAISYDPHSKCFLFAIARKEIGIPATVTYIDGNRYKNSKSPPMRGFPTYKDNYVPGWFGVDDLKEDDYDIYPGYTRVQKSDDVGMLEGTIAPDEENYKVNDYDETGKNCSQHSKPNEDHKSSHYIGNVVDILAPVNSKPAFEPSVPESSYKPKYQPVQKPIYKPHYVQVSTSTRKSYHFVSVTYNLLDPQCSRFFFVDSGTLAYPQKNIYIRRPVLWAFDITGCDEDSLNSPPVLKVTIPDDVVNDASGFYGISIDVYGSCNEFAVYMANVRDYRIVVYDNTKRSFWYFKSETFSPESEIPYLYSSPLLDNFNYSVMSITLGKRDDNKYRDAFYAPGSGNGLYMVSTETLRNKYIAPGDPTSTDFSVLGYRGFNNMAIMTYDNVTQVVLFISLLNNKVTCWNTNRQLNGDNISILHEDLTYGMDIYIDAERNVWFMLLDADSDTLGDRSQLTHYYYRLYVVPMDKLIAESGCSLSNIMV